MTKANKLPRNHGEIRHQKATPFFEVLSNTKLGNLLSCLISLFSHRSYTQNIFFYYIDTCVLQENKFLIKLIQNNIQDLSGVYVFLNLH